MHRAAEVRARGDVGRTRPVGARARRRSGASRDKGEARGDVDGVDEDDERHRLVREGLGAHARVLLCTRADHRR